ncbi:serine/threonine-protein kinase OXI1-like [Argentina anserina]|uniref:serine/threonine-protein kinase OXI1-like n=1 Tax=Argentina anserina TaxID=57926 RepID=UPI0021767D2E|nr:serine/threonine-protein kinase OXI1-like [Potentilla anserina]
MNQTETHRGSDDAVAAVPSFNFQRLRVITPLGRGAKGVVFLVQDQETDKLMALKVISRDMIHRKSKDGDGTDEYRRVCFEQQVLRRFDHPLLPKLHGVLDTENLVGYAIDYCSGRDLNSLRKRQTERMFSDDVIRFYAAELVLALEYLHALGVVYRDLKPENVMIQENGHIMLVDFDLSTNLSLPPIKTPQPAPRSNSLPKSASKKLQNKKKHRSLFRSFCNSGISPDDLIVPVETEAETEKSEKSESKTESAKSSGKSNSFVGTEEYVAPEIISATGHGFEVDWWSLGVLLYEMLYGTTPFRGVNRKETFYRILTKSPELTGEATPLRDLIRKLLEKDPRQRIVLEEIKEHEFFKGIGGSWDTVAQLARPPYIPEEVNEGRDGNKKIDVESVVEGIFGENKCGGGDEEEENKKKNVNKRVWEEELNHKPTQPDDTFSVF